MKKLMLIADDDAMYLKLLTDVLQAKGHTVIAAEEWQARNRIGPIGKTQSDHHGRADACS